MSSLVLVVRSRVIVLIVGAAVLFCLATLCHFQSWTIVHMSSDEGKDSQLLPASQVRRASREDAGAYLGNGYIDKSFSDFSTQEAQRFFHDMIVSKPYNCTTVERFGHARDGGYDMCVDGGLQPRHNDCIVYSFGIKGDWSFDEDINGRIGCAVHSFDPSLNMPDHVHKDNMYFHDLGVWGWNYKNDLGWDLKNLQTIVGMLGHTDRNIDHVKFDAEGAEWSLVEHIVQSGIHHQVKQMAFELHTPRRRKEQRGMSVNDYGEIVNAFQELSKVGFEIYTFYTRNNCCANYAILTPANISGLDKDLCCYEVSLVNKNFL